MNQYLQIWDWLLRGVEQLEVFGPKLVREEGDGWKWNKRGWGGVLLSGQDRGGIEFLNVLRIGGKRDVKCEKSAAEGQGVSGINDRKSEIGDRNWWNGISSNLWDILICVTHYTWTIPPGMRDQDPSPPPRSGLLRQALPPFFFFSFFVSPSPAPSAVRHHSLPSHCLCPPNPSLFRRWPSPQGPYPRPPLLHSPIRRRPLPLSYPRPCDSPLRNHLSPPPPLRSLLRSRLRSILLAVHRLLLGRLRSDFRSPGQMRLRLGSRFCSFVPPLHHPRLSPQAVCGWPGPGGLSDFAGPLGIADRTRALRGGLYSGGLP